MADGSESGRSENERLQILSMIESGVISVQEGLELLKALGDEPEAALEQEPEEVETEVSLESPGSMGEMDPLEIGASPSEADLEPEAAVAPQVEPAPEAGPTPEVEPAPTPYGVDPAIAHFRRWWMIPLWVGVGITVVGALLMFWAFQATGLSFWFACTWFPFLLGVLVLALAWGSRTMRWMHLRVTQAPGERPQHINISLPLPLGIAAWFLRTFGGYIPGLAEQKGLSDLLLSLEHTSPDQPFYVEVDEGEDGEKVQVFIG